MKAYQSGKNPPNVSFEISNSDNDEKSISYNLNSNEFKHYYEIVKGFYNLVLTGEIFKTPISTTPIIYSDDEPEQQSQNLNPAQKIIHKDIKYNYQKIDYNTAQAEAFRPPNVVQPKINTGSVLPTQYPTQNQNYQTNIGITQQSHSTGTQTFGNNQEINVVPITRNKDQWESGLDDTDFETEQAERDIRIAMEKAQKLLQQKQKANIQNKTELRKDKRNHKKEVKTPQAGPTSTINKSVDPLDVRKAEIEQSDVLIEDTVYMDGVDEEITKWMDDFQKKKELMKVKEMVMRSKKLQSKMKQKNELEKAFHSGKITLEEYITRIEKLLY